MTDKQKIIIMGAAGRDFHNFNVYFRENSAYDVVGFTATQIPNIEGRLYPGSIAGDLYPNGIPIFPEDDLVLLLDEHSIDQVIFAYSDISHEYVMHLASRVIASGADFRLMGTHNTQVKSVKPVVSVCAARTGSGKSQTSRYVAETLIDQGYKVAAIRHPMPYGDLEKQTVQRFATYDDLDLHNCTIEEREEYEPYVDRGMIIYAGIDYEKILRQAEAEVDIILWDGGNNDLPFYVSDLQIVVVDPHRPGHELKYHPGEANVIAADVIVINKIDTAEEASIAVVRENVTRLNPGAIVIEAASPIHLEDGQSIEGKRVLVVEDGPTLTHGGMAFGAGWIAAERFGAKEIIDPRLFAVGSIREVYNKYPSTGKVLPAMGYGDSQIGELEETINASDVDLVIIGTPIDLGRILKIDKPTVRVRYDLESMGDPTLKDVIANKFKNK
ncbi:MAG: cyclic 2,3-diphosphoglycerate synthase [Anaerolineales bacterium]